MQSAAAKPKPGNTPRQSWTIDGFTESHAKEMLAERPAHPLGGIWSATADGARVAVIAGDIPGRHGNGMPGNGYLIVVLRSPRPSITCGTVMGWATPAAKAGHFDCTLFTGCEGTALTAPRRFTLRLNDDSHLSLIEIHDGLEIVAWKAIPYMFRSFLRERHDRPRDLDGLIRLWPDDTGVPPMPRYL